MSSKKKRPASAPPALDPPPAEIRAMGHAAVEVVAEYLGALPNLPIHPDTTSREIRGKLDRELPVEGRDFGSLLAEFRDVIVPATRHNAHPRFFGYVASPGTAAAAYADLLASALNSNVTSWRSAPGPTELERVTIDWIKRIIGYPAGAEGLFISGGSLANLSGLAAARDAKAPLRVEEAGCQALERPLRLYMSSECHHSVAKAAGLLGIGHDNVRVVGVDARLRIDTRALEGAIEEDLAAGLQPFCVVASAGTVGTGACDPLDAVADVAAKHGLWFHVDGCYGGFAVLAPSKRDLFRGLERADSVALDPHKWLYVPSDCSCVLYRDPARARATFGHEADYIRVLTHHADDEAYAFWDYGPELTRRFRALKVWMMLAHVGTRALGEAIEGNCRCARHLADLVEQADDCELLAPVGLSIFCFRYAPPAMKAALAQADPAQRAALDRELDALNERILAEVQRGGSSYLSNATVGGRFALRGCVLNFRTTERDMEVLLEDVRQAGRRLSVGDGDRGLRP